MPKLPCVSGAKLIKILERLGFTRQRQRGSHVILRRDGNVCVVPLHRELDPGTLKGVLRQAELSVEEFIAEL